MNPGTLTVYRWELSKLRFQKRTYLGLGAAVVVLGGDDVPRHQRGDQREHPDRAEQQQHERDREAARVDVAPEGDEQPAAAPAGPALVKDAA